MEYGHVDALSGMKNNEFFEEQMTELRNNPNPDPAAAVLLPSPYQNNTAFHKLIESFWNSASWYCTDALGYSSREASQLSTTHRMVVWASVHEHDSHHQSHVHNDGLLSGVFYANVPADAGHLVFSDPRGVSPYHPQESPLSPFDEHRIAPKVGDIVLFPPWLPHRVESGETKETKETTAAHAAHDEVYNAIPAEHLLEEPHEDTPPVDPFSLRVSISFNVLGSWFPTAQVGSLNLKKGKTPLSVVGKLAKNTIPLVDGAVARQPQQSQEEDAAVVHDAEADWASMIERMRIKKSGTTVRGLGEAEYNKRPAGFPSRHGKD